MRIPLLRRLTILLLPALAASLLAACGGDDRDESEPDLAIAAINDTENGAPVVFDASRTFSEKITLSGRVEPGASVEVSQTTTTETGRKIDLDDPSAPAAGGWAASVVLERGSNIFLVTAIDKAGNSNRIRMDMVLADVMVTPANGASSVPLDTVITAVFRKPVAEPPAGSFQLFLTSDLTNPIQAELSFDSNTRTTATLDPESDLSPGATYKAVLSPSTAKITDDAGVELAETSVIFSTVAP